MKNGVLYTYLGLDVLAAAGGGIILAVSLITQKNMKAVQTIDTVATDLLLSTTPLKAGVVNAIFIFITFLVSFPGLIATRSRVFPKIHGYMVMLSGVFTMIIGLIIWESTLRTRSNLLTLWSKQSDNIQSLLQQRFSCCGYTNFTTPPFIQDSTCTNALVAANLGGCIGPFSSFANPYMDIIFTAVFGIVAIDGMLLLAIACLLKDRKDKERYRWIDQKNGVAI
ncbi:putative tetraspanin [Phaeomoniella chlamydospora]|uniref:Putative tetraspanin n=1 Tax=Phaeomoniella chlamydospora TaxID=158046 RepID=A0A0G2DVN5_PHACM|nr:putative tetraspanin [Phaeomoniella chlamydospora]